MKKHVIVLLALFLALPTVVFAGSATSRWDMTIGGYVKFDMGYNTQAQNQDIAMAARSSGASDNLADKYGNFFMSSGETHLNFLVRGPDAWGAKTSAFIEGYFGGQWIGQGNGTFGLRQAFMQFDWAGSKLQIGQTWNKWGLLPTFAPALLAYNNLGPMLKGMTMPLIRFEQNFARNWVWSFGILSPTNTMGGGAVANPYGSVVSSGVDGYTMSQMPFWEGSFGFTSDRCGNVGPWQMLFALEGFYGQQKMITGVINTNNTTTYEDKNINSWGVSFKGFIPIIPEKKGDKKGALTLSGVVFYTQNPGLFQSPVNAPTFATNYGYTSGLYNNFGSSNVINLNTAAGQAAYLGLDYAAPVQYGGWGQISYWITDKLFVNGWYGYVRSNVSQAWMNSAANTNAMVNTTDIIANIMYDVNAAVRMGFEYTYYNTRYAGYPGLVNGVPTASKDGSAQSFRFGAYYFF